MITVFICPICGNSNFQPFQSCKDYTVSQKTFDLQKCSNCNFVLTSPRPDYSKIGQYYQSEDYISHTNKASSIVDRIYLLARNYTLKWKIKLVGRHSEAKTVRKILDYGCGTGEFLNSCKNSGFNIFGIEPSELARPQAEKTTQVSICKSIENFLDKDFDAITLWHVLEHVPNLNETLLELKFRLASSGTIFIAVPNHISWDGEHYKEHWAGYDVPRHLWHFSPENMKLLLENNGLKLVHTIPMKLDSFYISLLSEKYKNYNQNSLAGLVKAFIIGLKSNIKASTTGKYSSLIYIAKK